MTKKEDALTVLHGTGSATTRDVAEKAGMPKNTARKSLAVLKGEGKVDQTAEGRWHVK